MATFGFRPRRDISPRYTDHDYADGHRETIAEFMNRGGAVARVTAGWSRHQTDEGALLSRLNGSDPDSDRFEGWDDLTIEVRNTIAARHDDAEWD